MSTHLEYILIIVYLTSVGGYMLYDIQEDYCELYLNASKISDKICLIKKDVIYTNEYSLELVKYDLHLQWFHDNFIEWNTIAVTTDMKNVSLLTISGLRSSDDHRLRPASYYLNKLNLEHVKHFQISSQHFMIEERHVHYKEGPTYLMIDFNHSVNLGRVNEYVAASTRRIQILGISGIQMHDSVLCDYFQFFSFPELQENVEDLRLNVDMTVQMKCFENYHRLKYIFFDGHYEPFENLTAFIRQSGEDLIFTMGTNGQRCHADCECSYSENFQVDCSYRKFTQIPPIPIPIVGDIELDFSVNLLSQLPSNTLPGYADVVSLDVSYNKITSIGIHQLPGKLNTLDISNNLITTVDAIVANYLIRIELAYHAIRWNANCDERRLVKLLHKHSGFYEQLNGSCPHKCICCFDRTTEIFLINCTSLNQFQLQLPNHIPNKVTLLLANCQLRELPKKLPHNITNLDIRNNSLMSLDGAIVSLYTNPNNTTIKLSGNPWTCYCKDKSFLNLLKSRDPLEFAMALNRCNIFECPEGCICCRDSSQSPYLTVDCQGQRLTRFPILPDSVTTLDLRNNYIQEINQDSKQLLNTTAPTTLLKVLLSGNPWSCTCEKNGLFLFAKNISRYIPDFDEMYCSNLGKSLAFVKESDICPSYFIYISILIVFILIMAIFAFFYFK